MILPKAVKRSESKSDPVEIGERSTPFKIGRRIYFRPRSLRGLLMIRSASIKPVRNTLRRYRCLFIVCGQGTGTSSFRPLSIISATDKPL
jgi:hypothetical protein